MKEQKVAKKGEFVYALIKGGSAATSSVETQVLDPKKAIEAARKAKLKEQAARKNALAKDEEAVRAVNRALNEEKVRESMRMAKKGKEAVPAAIVVDAKYFPPDATLPPDPAMAEAIEHFYMEAGNAPLRDLPKEMLMRQYVLLARQAEEINAQRAFLRNIEEALEAKDVVVEELLGFTNIVEKAKEAADRHIKEREDEGEHVDAGELSTIRLMAERGYAPGGDLPQVEGGATTRVTADPAWAAIIQNEIEVLNSALNLLPDDDIRNQLHELSSTHKNISRITGVPPNQIQEALERIKTTYDELVNVEVKNPRLDLVDRLEKMSLTPEDVKKNAVEPIPELDEAAYTNDRLKTIAAEVVAKAAAGEANNEYLRGKINEIVGIRAQAAEQYTDEAKKLEEEAYKLYAKVQELKETLDGRSRELRQKEVQLTSFQGESRMTLVEKQRLVQLALDATETSDRLTPAQKAAAEREIERTYYQLFSAADARSLDEWRDALGNARQIEIDELITTLVNARTGRMTHEGKLLNPDQRNRIEILERKLTGESKLREYLHNVTQFVNKAANAEQIHKAMASFKAEDADRAFRVKGVSHAAHLYEQAMLQVMARHGGYLSYEAMVNRINGKLGEVEQLVYDNMQASKTMGILSKDTENWEISRAVSLARGMGVVSGRFFEIVAAGGIPKERPLVSWWANSIIKNIAFFRQVARYNFGFKRNAMLKYKLEGSGPFWRTKELEEAVNMSATDILDAFVNETDAQGRPYTDRYINMLNPFRVGSVYTQTGWRWGADKIDRAGGIAHILDGDVDSPIIGLGMWIEKLRGDYSGHDHKKSEEAGEKLEKQIKHSIEITPLKFFYNLNGLRQQILRGRQLRALYRGEKPVEEVDRTLHIKSKNLEEDLSALALLQERLLRKRAAAYKEYLDKRYDKDRNIINPNVKPPNLFSPAFTEFEYSSLEEAQAGRVKALAGIIKNEFMHGKLKGVRDTHYKRLMFNLKEKGWKVPFVFGTDDIPHEIYSYAGTGDNSFERRWGDIESVANGAKLYEDFIRHINNMKKQEDIIQLLQKIHDAVLGHDENVAREVMERTIEGVTKFFKKDIVARLPAGLGWLKGFIGGKASYAQLAFGRDQMAWDEVQVDAFLKMAREAGLVGDQQIEDLRKKTGARWWNLGLGIGRTLVSLGFLSFIYYMFKEVGGDTLKSK